jgi:putative lipoprotein
MKNRARWAGLAALVAALAGEPTCGSNPPTISFRNGRIRGDSGCNTFSADVTLEQMTIDVGSISSTLRLCEGDVGATETMFMRALIGASSLSFDEKGNLLLGGDGGDVQFVASR